MTRMAKKKMQTKKKNKFMSCAAFIKHKVVPCDETNFNSEQQKIILLESEIKNGWFVDSADGESGVFNIDTQRVHVKIKRGKETQVVTLYLTTPEIREQFYKIISQ